MPQAVSVDEVEALHADYHQCAQELEHTLNKAKSAGLTTGLAEKITELNRRCEELMHQHLKAFRACYGKMRQ